MGGAFLPQQEHARPILPLPVTQEMVITWAPQFVSRKECVEHTHGALS
jgi:hypothetical protein